MAQLTAVVVLVTPAREITLDALAVDGADPLAALDLLLRLRLAAHRLGWGLRVECDDAGLAELAELAGVSSTLGLRAPR